MGARCIGRCGAGHGRLARQSGGVDGDDADLARHAALERVIVKSDIGTEHARAQARGGRYAERLRRVAGAAQPALRFGARFRSCQARCWQRPWLPAPTGSSSGTWFHL